MKWTKEKPTKYGFYWAIMDEPDDCPTLIKVSKDMYASEYLAYHFGNELGYSLDDYVYFSEPLELPERK